MTATEYLKEQNYLELTTVRIEMDERHRYGSNIGIL